MAGVVTTSIVIQFGDEDSEQYHLTAEVDSRLDGFNKGNTKFIPGDSPAILVYRSPELSLQLIASTGSLGSLGTGTIDVEEYLIFANEATAQLSKPPQGSVTLKRLSGPTGARVVGKEVVLSQAGVGVYKANYKAKYDAYRLKNVPTTLNGETSFPVVIVIIGTAA